MCFNYRPTRADDLAHFGVPPPQLPFDDRDTYPGSTAPSYETGKAERWRIAWADGAPMAIAGLWERRHWEDGVPSWSYTLLTLNAEAHPFMRRFSQAR